MEDTQKYGGEYTFHSPTSNEVDHYKVTIVKKTEEHCPSGDSEYTSSFAYYYVPSQY